MQIEKSDARKNIFRQFSFKILNHRVKLNAKKKNQAKRLKETLEEIIK